MIADLPEPTTYASTPTAAVLAPGRVVASLGAGYPALKSQEQGAFSLHVGVGADVELAVAAGFRHSPPVYPTFTDHWGTLASLGLKRGFGRLGEWDVAGAVAGSWGLGGPFQPTAWAAVPFTRTAGAWQWTVGPRVNLPDPLATSTWLNGSTIGLMAGGLCRFHESWAWWFEANPTWFQTGFPVLGPSVGLRGRVGPGTYVEAGLGLDLFQAGYYPLAPERLGLLTAAVKQVF